MRTGKHMVRDDNMGLVRHGCSRDFLSSSRAWSGKEKATQKTEQKKYLSKFLSGPAVVL